jgi:hypothetical protein
MVPGTTGIAAAMAAVAMLVPSSALAAKHPLLFGLNDAPGLSERPESALDLHVGLGATVQRVAISWRGVQPREGVWSWTVADRAYAEPARRGLASIAVVGSPPAWAATRTLVYGCILNGNGPGCHRPPAPDHLEDFGRFVAAVAERYPRLAAIEVFNEPNLASFNWQPAADPEYYASVLRVAYRAAGAVRPELPVISGGLATLPDPPPPGSMDPHEFLDRVYRSGAAGWIDGIGIHPYPGPAAPTDSRAFDLFLERVRSIRNAYGDARRPLWITETGYTTTGTIAVSEEQQASWLPELVAKGLRSKDVRAVVVHTLADRDGPADDLETGFGVTRADLTPKPVYAELAAVVRAIAREWTPRTRTRCRGSRARRAACRRARRCARARKRHKRLRPCRRRAGAPQRR